MCHWKFCSSIIFPSLHIHLDSSWWSFVGPQVLRDPYDDTLQFAIVSIPSGVQRWKSLALDNDHEYVVVRNWTCASCTYLSATIL